MKRHAKLLLLLLAGDVAATPQLLPFQGHLTDAGGNAIADGAKVVQFKIYDAPVSGTAVWAGEVHKLSVNGGLVNTILGTKTAFSETYSGGAKVMFSEPLYLEITVDADGSETITAADPPLLPRQVLLPSNFSHVAMSAETVEGVDLVDDATGTLWPTVLKENSILAVHLADGSVGAGEISDDSITEDDLSPALRQRLSLGLIPPGTIAPYSGDVAPPGWALCYGQEVSRISPDYVALEGIIGDGRFGLAADPASDFKLPDLRGYFLRGVDGPDGSAGDRDPDIRNFQGPTALGTFVGSVQSDELQSHSHGYSDHRTGGNPSAGNPSEIGGGVTYPRYYASSTTRAAGGSETRPINIAVNYIIKL
ncbi:tail fiber protein [Roseibacillus ishigakijimensis]|uniref:Tail fiber protein n=1 Tax=Roseibacillus ishigakijimensis TaxID=454146 RepID=A0A934VIG6_9BACT|nr:tail fiber protein [Roseibacillus ishigakijimensis]MBK1835053.1 tail fiber protein [Roseibacillus ishigakijimensis]